VDTLILAVLGRRIVPGLDQFLTFQLAEHLQIGDFLACAGCKVFQNGSEVS
jgi:hypothetical protein